MAEWLSGEKIHEGFPLLLRRAATIDAVSLRPRFPLLAFVTHALTRVTSNGLPEHAYNIGLAELDHELLTAFDAEPRGVAVLVETYAGERCYYFYVAANADASGVISTLGGAIHESGSHRRHVPIRVGSLLKVTPEIISSELKLPNAQLIGSGIPKRRYLKPG